MTVDTAHKLHAERSSTWKKVRDFVAGGQKVLPYVRKLPGHDVPTETAFRARAYYLPAIARSLDAFTGLIMNPEPVIEAPESMADYLKDVSFDGEPASRMIGRTVREICEVGRCAIVADYPMTDANKTMSVADAEAEGLRAYARLYTAENVIDWRVTSRGGERYLSFLKLRETFDQPGADEWTITEEEQIRVLDFNDAGAYRQRIFRKIETTDDKTGKRVAGWFQHGADIIPQANGAALDEIPAVVFNPDSLDASEVDQPPMLEMVEIADSHLQTSALHEWALLWVGNPTPVFINLRLAEGASVALGSSQGISCGEGGDAKMLYLPAEGVGALAAAMEAKRRDMAAVGARLLADETSAQIARDTAIIQRAGEHSVLAQIAATVADGWQRVLGYLAMWAGVEGEDIVVTLNTDFVPQGMTSGELSELIAAIQAGQYTSRDLFALLQKRGLIRPDKSFEEHQDEIEEDGANALLQPPVSGGQDQQVDPEDPNANQQDQQQQAA